jgi:hypothetical protein
MKDLLALADPPRPAKKKRPARTAKAAPLQAPS